MIEIAEPAVLKAVRDWQDWLAHERRYSVHTLDAYSRDVVSFLKFLTGHLGHRPGIADLDRLSTRDFRGYLSRRNSDGLERTSTARAMSTLKSFFKFLEREGRIANTIIQTVRIPKVPKSIPKALSVEDAEVRHAVGVGEDAANVTEFFLQSATARAARSRAPQ